MDAKSIIQLPHNVQAPVGLAQTNPEQQNKRKKKSRRARKGLKRKRLLEIAAQQEEQARVEKSRETIGSSASPWKEPEEVKSNSLDKVLTQKETELLVNPQANTNLELVHTKTQREFEVGYEDLRDSKAECANLTEKISNLGRNQSSSTVDEYGEIIQKQKNEMQELRERIGFLVQYRADKRSQELIKALDSERAELRNSNKDLVAENEAFKKREMDQLELTEKLTQKNIELLSDNSSLENKVLSLTKELQTIKMKYQGTDDKMKELTESLNAEKALRKEETYTLNQELALKCKAVDDLTKKVEEGKDEIKTLKVKHTDNVRDLTHQLQLVRRKLETYEASTNDDKVKVSIGSQTSSNGSPNIAEQPNTQVVQPNQPNHTTNQLTTPVQNHVPVEPGPSGFQRSDEEQSGPAPDPCKSIKDAAEAVVNAVYVKAEAEKNLQQAVQNLINLREEMYSSLIFNTRRK